MAIQLQSSLDRTFHALGDESRRRMLAKISREGECTAGELGAEFDFAQPTISKHIKVLERAGLVERNVDGRLHRFSLVQDPLDAAADWISHHRQFWEGTLARLEDFVLGGDETDGGADK